MKVNILIVYFFFKSFKLRSSGKCMPVVTKIGLRDKVPDHLCILHLCDYIMLLEFVCFFLRFVFYLYPDLFIYVFANYLLYAYL